MKKIKYQFDKLISQNPKGLMAIFTFITMVFLGIIAGVITLINIKIPKNDDIKEKAEGIFEAYFKTYIELIDIVISPEFKTDINFWITLLNIIVAILGLLLISVLIGILTNIIQTRLVELRRGRSVVIESNHTVFLGWSNKLITTIHELSEAYKSEKKGTIVVMSIKDKIFMEECLFREIPANSNTSVICRTGHPSDFKDLEIISPNTAKSIVLLATDDEYSDSMVLKTALALQKNEHVNCTIIAEVNSAENAEALKLLSKLTIIQPRNFIMRLLAQALKDPGLSEVYSELLTFSGKEIYFWPKLDENNEKFQKYIVGKKFSESIFEFENSSLIGIVKDSMSLDDNSQTDAVKLLPENDYIIKSTDRLILISEDDSSIGNSVGKSTFTINTELDLQINKDPYTYNKKHITIIGWHSWGDILLNELQNQLPKGSQIDIFYNPELSSSTNKDLLVTLDNLSVNVNLIKDLKKESFNMINWQKTESILILGNRDKLNIQEADSYTLLTFIHVKNLRDKQTQNINVCCEILDPKNAELIDGTRDDEFVASDELVAKYLMQLSENKFLKAVYSDLLDEAGAELFLRSSSAYVNNNEPISFGDLVSIGLLKNEIVVGIQEKESSHNHNVNSILSPDKSRFFKLEKNDRIIVLANN